MKYTINYSSRFKKSYKLCKRRGLNIANFENERTAKFYKSFVITIC